MPAETSDAHEQVKYDLLVPSFFADPHSVFHRMRAEDPVHWHPGLKAWMLTRYGDIQAMVRDPRFSAQRLGQFGLGASEAMKPKLERANRFMSHWIVTQDPPRHTILRALLAKAFTPQVVEGMRPAIEALVDEMLEVVIDAGQMDIIRDLAFPLPAIVISKLIGVPQHRIDAFKAWTSQVFVLLGAGIATDEAIESGYQGVLGLEGYFRELIAERRGAPADDLLSRLITAEEQGVFLSEEELVSTCAMLLVGGHETTTHFIGNSVLALLKNPAELKKLRDDPSLVDGAIDELLRHQSSIFMLSRRALEDVEIAGVQIRTDEYVFGFVHGGNRDPAVFEDPDRLDVTRKGVKSLAFGHGIHHCIGAALARLQAAIALRAIVTRLPGLARASDTEEWLPSIALRGLATLPVRFEPRAARRTTEPPPSWSGPASLREPLSSRTPMSVPPPPPSFRVPRAT